MYEILKYLKDPVNLNDEKIGEIDDKLQLFLESNYKKYQSFFNTNSTNESIQEMHSTTINSEPSLSSGQIWLTKKKYIDYEGNEIEGKMPYYVYLSDNCADFMDMESIRVQPLSLFLEFAANDDIPVDNENITGFRFFIETWNEQPLATYLLDSYIGELDLTGFSKITDRKLSQSHNDFRKYEIRNTAFLRQSVISYLSWLDNVQSDDNGVVINLGNIPIYPPMDQYSEPKQQLFQALSKAEIDEENEIFVFNEGDDNTDLPIKISIIKSSNHTFTIIVDDKDGLTLEAIDDVYNTDENGIIIKKSPAEDDREVKFINLESGLYFLKFDSIKQQIKIRLK